MRERSFRFEWDEAKAAGNLRKHGVSFDLAHTIFNDPHLLTIADLEHDGTEDRWFSIGTASNGAVLSVAYLWAEVEGNTTKIRIISARRSTKLERRDYE